MDIAQEKKKTEGDFQGNSERTLKDNDLIRNEPRKEQKDSNIADRKKENKISGLMYYLNMLRRVLYFNKKFRKK